MGGQWTMDVSTSRITRPSSAYAAANRSIAASASVMSPSTPRSSSVSTRGIVKLSEVGAVANHISLMRHI